MIEKQAKQPPKSQEIFPAEKNPFLKKISILKYRPDWKDIHKALWGRETAPGQSKD